MWKSGEESRRLAKEKLEADRNDRRDKLTAKDLNNIIPN